MREKRYISKLLSKVLRHKPEELGVYVDEQGWVFIDELILKMREKNIEVDFDKIENIVRTNNKQRFELNEEKTKIRATYGHSIDVDLCLQAIEPPELLYHGTSAKNFEKIKTDDLIKPMKRLFVHLTDNIDMAEQVGKRHEGETVLLLIKAKEMYGDNFVFYRAKNGVYLTKEISMKYVEML